MAIRIRIRESTKAALRSWIGFLSGNWFPLFPSTLKFLLLFVGGVVLDWQLYLLLADVTLLFFLFRAPYARLDWLEPEGRNTFTVFSFTSEGGDIIVASTYNDSNTVREIFAVLVYENQIEEQVREWQTLKPTGHSHNKRLFLALVEQGIVRDDMAVISPRGRAVWNVAISDRVRGYLYLPASRGEKPYRLHTKLGNLWVLGIEIYYRNEGEKEFKRDILFIDIIWLSRNNLSVYKAEDLNSKKQAEIQKLILAGFEARPSRIRKKRTLSKRRKSRRKPTVR